MEEWTFRERATMWGQFLAHLVLCFPITVLTKLRRLWRQIVG